MYEKVSKTMDELMEYLLFEVKSRGLPTDEFRMQKLIFKIKMELGEDHELYPLLPFYWYVKGPYSEVATVSYEKKLPQINTFKREILKDYPEIEDISDNILEKREYFINEIDRDIYMQYAPYKFMYLYKYKIYNVAKASDEVDFDVEGLIDEIYVCEGNLAKEEYFFDFNTNFAKLSIYLELIRKAGNFEKYWNFLQKPVTLTWKTFAKGVRIYFKDDYYNDNVEQWDKEFEASLNELSALVKKTKTLINFDDYPKNNYTAKEVNMLDSTIGAYLR